MFGILYCPLNLRRTLLSIPFGFLQFDLTLRYRSDWCLINFFVLFLTHVRFTRGRIAIVTILCVYITKGDEEEYLYLTSTDFFFN